jgi:predicted O-methyltransferase YrrM
MEDMEESAPFVFDLIKIENTETTMPENGPTTGDYNDYITNIFAQEDSALSETRAEMEREGVPSINVSASEGKLLHVLALSIGAKRILEVGTLGGYSAIWFARALPEGGKLISLELEPHHANVARRNLIRAGVSDKVEIRVGPASETLASMQDEEPFDLAFIDANKDGYVDYFAKVYPLVREGGLILGDNTLPDAILNKAEDTGTMAYNDTVAAKADLVTTIIPVLRDHGIDGLTVSIKKG